MNVVLAIVLVVGILSVLVWLGRRSMRTNLERKRTDAFVSDFVYVTDDGTVREVTMDEQAHLNTAFDSAEGVRPLPLKTSYASTAPDGTMGGFLYRSLLPTSVRWVENDA